MSIPAVVFVLYLVAVMGVGWLSLRLTGSEADYWIAGGRLGWLLGGATLAATHVSAGTYIGTIGVMYTAGWSFGWLVLSIPLAYWFVAAVLAPRFTRVRELTLPAFMETRYYSRNVRALAAAIILVAYVVYIQAQIVAGGLIANTVFGFPLTASMIGFTALLLGYTVVGGMFAVVYADLFQLIVMVVAVVCAVPVAVRQVGGVDELFRLVQAVNPRTFTWDGLPATLLFTMGLAFFLGSISGPEKLVRLYTMRDMPTIRRGILFAIVAITGINLLVFVLSLVAVVLFPALPTGDLAMPMLTRAVLPPVMGTVMLAAIASAMLSTVDALLLVAGSALSRDIWETLFERRPGPRAASADDEFHRRGAEDTEGPPQSGGAPDRASLHPTISSDAERVESDRAPETLPEGSDSVSSAPLRWNQSVPSRRGLLVARVGTFLVGTVPLALVLAGVGRGTLVQFIVLLFTALMGASFFAPVVLGVLWRRATREGAAAAMVGGVAVTLAWKALGPASIDPVLPGFLTSVALMVGVSLATPAPPESAIAPYFGVGSAVRTLAGVAAGVRQDRGIGGDRVDEADNK
ncbi:MAG TPA: sodium:solute symporter family protein [Longimicrobiales bacterium]|nr:sodium:solute symporter family protein [Longimicrobiales bacterium]